MKIYLAGSISGGRDFADAADDGPADDGPPGIKECATGLTCCICEDGT